MLVDLNRWVFFLLSGGDDDCLVSPRQEFGMAGLNSMERGHGRD